MKNIEALHIEIVISALNYDSHLIKEVLGKLNFETNVLPKWIRKMHEL